MFPIGSFLPNLANARTQTAGRSFGCLARSSADEPPVIPIGLNAFTRWNRWPFQRIGARTVMPSTYDRRGGNESADASQWQESWKWVEATDSAIRRWNYDNEPHREFLE